MKINHRKTLDKFNQTGFSQRKIARLYGHEYAIFHLVLHGSYKAMGSKAALAVIATLRKLDVLVEEPNGDDEVRAA